MADKDKLIDLSGLGVVYEDVLNTVTATLEENYVKNADVQNSKEVIPSTSDQTVTPDAPYLLLKKVVVKAASTDAVDTQEKTIEGSTIGYNGASATPDSGRLLSKVTVTGLPNTSNVDASQILSGVTVVKTTANSNSAVTGTMPNIGKQIINLTSTNRSSTISKGYHDGTGVVSIPADYFAVNSSNTTASSDKVLNGYKFVDATGTTVTGNIPTVTPTTIVPSVTATAGTASITKQPSAAANITTTGIETSTTNTGYAITATASASSGTITATGGSASVTSGSFTVDKGYVASNYSQAITGDSKSGTTASTTEQTANDSETIYIKKGSYNAEVATHTITSPTITPRTYGSILNIAELSQPTGVDGEDYYTISIGQAGSTSGSSKVTAKATIDTEGYIASGSETSTESSKPVNATLNPPATLFYVKSSDLTENKTVTPTTGSQTVSVSAGYTPGATITVNAIPNQKTAKNETLSVSTSAAQTVTIPAGYYTADSTVTLPKQDAVTISNTSVTPSTSSQTVTVSKGWNETADTITVAAMPTGSYAASVSDVSVTKPKANLDATGSAITYISNVINQSLTNLSLSSSTAVEGEDYYTITPSLASATAGSAKATGTATVSTAGYIATGSKTSAEKSTNIGVDQGTAKTYYVKNVKHMNIAASTVADADVPESSSDTTPTLVIDPESDYKWFNTYNGGVQENKLYTIPNGVIRSGKIYVKKITAGIDSDIKAANIVTGKNIMGVAGTFSSTSNGATASDILSGKEAFVNGSKVTGNMPNIGKQAINLTTSTRSVSISKGYHDGTGTASIPSDYYPVNSTNTTATASTVLSGSKFVNATGTAVTGTMTNNGATGATLDSTTQSYTIPAGYTTGGTVNISVATLAELKAALGLS